MQQLGTLKEAFNHASHEVKLHEVNDLIADAVRAEPLFKGLALTIANKLNVSSDAIVFGEIKSPGCIVNKAIYEKHGNIYNVNDILRATIPVESMEIVKKAGRILHLMQEDKLRCLKGIKPFGIKDTFKDASFSGFGMLKANFDLGEFDASEIQFCLHADSKKMALSHSAYEVERACAHARKNFERWPDRLTEEEKAELSLYIDKKGRSAAAQREQHNMMAYRQ